MISRIAALSTNLGFDSTPFGTVLNSFTSVSPLPLTESVLLTVLGGIATQLQELTQRVDSLQGAVQAPHPGTHTTPTAEPPTQPPSATIQSQLAPLVAEVRSLSSKVAQVTAPPAIPLPLSAGHPPGSGGAPAPKPRAPKTPTYPGYNTDSPKVNGKVTFTTRERDH